jgi:hypothetical protein
LERDGFLLGAAAGRVVTQVGFADAGPRGQARRDGGWLHARLATVARSLVGVDVDPDGVAYARAHGFEAYQVDCRDPEQVTRAAIRPAELLVVADLIDQVDAVGPFLEGLRALAAPSATMIVTTPNASRLVNTAAALVGRELAHLDCVGRYSWYTLVNVLQRHGWPVVGFHTYLATADGARGGAGLLLAAERAAARRFAPYLAGGLIAVCRGAALH